MGIKTFGVLLRDENWECVTDNKGILHHDNIDLSLEEAQEIIAGAVKIEKSRYGWEVYSDKKNGNISIYFRFGNVTVKKSDSIESFIKKNWSKN